jgi:site-specific DNA-methyltransferase (adenine-specific)
MEYKLILGDCLLKLKELEDNSVDSIVTDPPYHLTSIVKRFGKEGSAPAKPGKDGSFGRLSKGFMGQEWDGGDIAFRTEVWEECLRVLKPGGHLIAFSGSRTYHRMAYAIDESGFEIRDQIMWVYGSGFPKSHNVGKKVPDFEGWGTALKPAHEPIVLARKPFKCSVSDNVLEHGTGAINIDGCRVGDEEIYVNGKGNKFVDSLPHGKRTGESVLGVNKTHTGRYPANFIHDGLEEEWSKYFYCAKASKKDREDYNNHPTVKPTELMRYLIRLVTPKDGTVLDPFMGSGSTGKAAVLEGFDFIGIELSEDYLNIAKSRIENAITNLE